MRQFLALLILGGCNALYGLDPTDVAHAPDGDRDGVADADDNCPSVANPTQNDEDRDTFGDLCDNCPLVFNPEQRDVGDGDGIGDRCDPHPIAAGDCLRVFDSFDTDPLTYWKVVGGSVRADAGSVTLVPPPNGDAALLLAPDIVGGVDVQLTGFAQLGWALAVANASSAANLAGCGGRRSLAGTELVVASIENGTDKSIAFYNGPQLGTAFLFALTSSFGGSTGCRAELGAALGFQTNVPYAYPPGNPGALAEVNPVDLHGIAIYEQRTDACPEAVFR